jgi:hypothetical protein
MEIVPHVSSAELGIGTEKVRRLTRGFAKAPAFTAHGGFQPFRKGRFPPVIMVRSTNLSQTNEHGILPPGLTAGCVLHLQYAVDLRLFCA